MLEELPYFDGDPRGPILQSRWVGLPQPRFEGSDANAVRQRLRLRSKETKNRGRNLNGLQSTAMLRNHPPAHANAASSLPSDGMRPEGAATP
jgi:hypothetical protein